MSKRDRVTATSLVRLLDPLSSYGRPVSPPSPDYLSLLQYSATAKQARKLVDALFAAQLGSPATTAANRDLLYELDSRLSSAEQQLARLAPTQSSSLLSPPPEVVHKFSDTDPWLSSDLANLDYLAVPSPTVPAFEFVDQATQGQALLQADREAEHQDADLIDDDDGGFTRGNALLKPSDLRSASLRSNGVTSSRRSPVSSTTVDVDADVSRPIGPGTSSSLDPALTTSTARQRRGRPQADTGGGESAHTLLSPGEKPVPAYLAAKRARAAAEKKRLAELAGSDDEKQDDGDDDLAVPTPDKVAKKLDDLIPADAVPVGGSGGGGGDLLGQHHALQTSLLSSLTSLSGALKQSTLSFSDNLAKDKEVMTRAQEQLETSETRMKRQQARLKEVRGKSRGTTCWTLGLLAVVFVLWLLTFLLIKVT